jgi:DNA-binding transcriptional MerR regulator/methylmalonyl-CoA mutase cobalamin-binding subunit
MYTIKQAAMRSGVPVELLRAWERRYGVVQPIRTSGGYRLYDDASIARLRAMRSMIDGGWAPSTAAARIRELGDGDVAQVLAPPNGAGANGQNDPALTSAFVEFASELDETGVEKVLDEMFVRGSFEQVATDLVMPALRALGDGWERGVLDVAAEHAASGAVQRRLGSAFMAAGVPSSENVVLVGLPPGARHDLGALAFATAARRAGIAVRYLGPDLPAADWLDAVQRAGARAVVIGAVMPEDAVAATKVARELRRAHPRLLICFGGREANAIPLENLQPVVVLPQELAPAVQALRDEIRAG